MKIVMDQIEQKIGKSGADALKSALPGGLASMMAPQVAMAAPVPAFAQAYTQAPVGTITQAPGYGYAQAPAYAQAPTYSPAPAYTQAPYMAQTQPAYAPTAYYTAPQYSQTDASTFDSQEAMEALAQIGDDQYDVAF